MPFFDPIRIGASGSVAADFTVGRSLRFNDDDSAYLARTPSSAGNRRTWTLSYWVKRGNITSNQGIFGAESSGDRLVIGFGNGGSDQARFTANPLLRISIQIDYSEMFLLGIILSGQLIQHKQLQVIELNYM